MGLLNLSRCAPQLSRLSAPQWSSPSRRSSMSSSATMSPEPSALSALTSPPTRSAPTPGYGYHSYGHNYCKEVAQETCYNSPVVTPTEPAVTVAYPEPTKTCVDKPIDLPRISCEDLTENKCITVPEVQDAIATVDKCITQLGAPDCQQVELTLPKQVCKEINYGYAEETHDVEPVTYAPAPPPPTYAPAYAAAEA